MEVPAHSDHTHPRMRPYRNEYRTPITVMRIAVLSDYLKFQVTRSQFIYLGPPISACAQIIDISGKTITTYGSSCLKAMLGQC